MAKDPKKAIAIAKKKFQSVNEDNDLVF